MDESNELQADNAQINNTTQQNNVIKANFKLNGNISENYCTIGDEQLRKFYDMNKDNIMAMISCPITTFIPSDPVVADDGHIYDEDAIRTWFSTSSTKSPITNQVITNDFTSIPIWNDIINTFERFDPDLKELRIEKDFTFLANKDTICNILYGSQNKHCRLKKFKEFKLSEKIGLKLFAYHLFTKCYDYDTIVYILENSLDTNFINESTRETISHYAFRYSTFPIIEYIADKKYGLDVVNKNGETPFVLGLFNKNINIDVELINKMLDKIGDINLKINDMELIHKVVIEAPLLVVQKVIDAGADITKPTDANFTPFALAVEYKKGIDTIIYIIGEMIKKDPMLLNAPMNDNGDTISHLICKKYSKYMNAIKYLLSLDTNMEAENNKKWRPIHYICRYGSRDVIEYMMGIGLNLETLCDLNGKFVPPYNLLELNPSINAMSRNELIAQFIEFIQIIKLSMADMA